MNSLFCVVKLYFVIMSQCLKYTFIIFIKIIITNLQCRTLKLLCGFTIVSEHYKNIKYYNLLCGLRKKIQFSAISMLII